MVQFIPQAQGSQSFPPDKLQGVAAILQGLSQAMGAPNAQGQSGGAAAVLNAMRNKQPTYQRLGMLAPSAPLQPGAQGPVAPPNPLGPLANMPFNKFQQLSDTLGKGGISSILGNQAGTTLYMDPATGSLSMNQTPGSVPIGGYKGPAAATAIQKSGDETRKAKTSGAPRSAPHSHGRTQAEIIRYFIVCR